jgi:uncharacterized protein (DUF1778 family)
MMKDTTVSIRLPGDLREQLKAAADADKRSLSSFMVIALQEWIATSKPKSPAAKSLKSK